MSEGALRADLPDDYVMTDADLRRIADLLRKQSGISLSPSKHALVYSRLSKRLRKLGLKSFSQYCKLLESDDGADERHELLTALTTNVTRFFREPHHFEDLQKNLLAPIKDDVQRGRRLRIWSAACSTGEEPYSIALSLASVIEKPETCDVRILATDIDHKVLERAEAASYPENLISDISAADRARWFDQGSAGWRPKANLRGLVRFAEYNLLDPLPMNGTFDAIFCRNVAIYFDRDLQSQVWAKLCSRLAVGGRLYIGHSERISGPADDLLEPVGITAYRKIRSH